MGDADLVPEVAKWRALDPTSCTEAEAQAVVEEIEEAMGPCRRVLARFQGRASDLRRERQRREAKAKRVTERSAILESLLPHDNVNSDAVRTIFITLKERPFSAHKVPKGVVCAPLRVYMAGSAHKSNKEWHRDTLMRVKVDARSFMQTIKAHGAAFTCVRMGSFVDLTDRLATRGSDALWREVQGNVGKTLSIRYEIYDGDACWATDEDDACVDAWVWFPTMKACRNRRLQNAMSEARTEWLRVVLWACLGREFAGSRPTPSSPVKRVCEGPGL
jgi:hypothetical protein